MEPIEAGWRAGFDPVPLPAWEPGGRGPGALDEALRGWAASEPLRALADASGWDWPTERDTLVLLERLADLSTGWDFRKSRERNFIEGGPADVNGRTVPAELVLAAARALGMVDAFAVPCGDFSHLVVLSGLVTACVNRTHRAADLVRGGLGVGAVAVLGAHRTLGGAEPGQAVRAGLGELTDEAEVIVAATRKAFGLGSPLSEQRSCPPADCGCLEAANAASALYRWPSVEVVIAPSSEPGIRRANTADQLRHWADVAGVGARHKVLILTTQLYVPYQHIETVRVLGLERGCGVWSCGVDAAGSLLRRVAPFGGRDYLQEVRSVLRAAYALSRAARERQ